MLSSNQVPKAFKILSEFPVLIIEYHERKALYPIKLFFIIIVMVLILLTFAGVVWFSIEPLSTLKSRMFQPDFWHFPRAGTLYFDESRFSLPGLVAIIMFLFFPIFIIYELIWSLFGISQFKAYPEKLIVKHQLFGISRTHSIRRDSLLCFKEYEVVAAKNHQTKGWTLAAIVNKKIFFLLRLEIPVFSAKPFQSSHWLGTALANFYQVEFQQKKRRL